MVSPNYYHDVTAKYTYLLSIHHTTANRDLIFKIYSNKALSKLVLDKKTLNRMFALVRDLPCWYYRGTVKVLTANSGYIESSPTLLQLLRAEVLLTRAT
jgi:hypothetical protein